LSHCRNFELHTVSHSKDDFLSIVSYLQIYTSSEQIPVIHK